MKINMLKISGMVAIIGSVLFLVAAFLPISRVFGEPDPAKKMEIINLGRNAWTIAQVLFILGAIVTAGGFVMLSFSLRSFTHIRLVHLAMAEIVIGAGLWAWYVYMREVDPRAFVGGDLPGWPFGIYTVLTQAGLILIGISLLHTVLPNWVGWMLIIVPAILFIAFLIFRDMPPFFYYILTLVMGIMIVIRG